MIFVYNEPKNKANKTVVCKINSPYINAVPRDTSRRRSRRVLRTTITSDGSSCATAGCACAWTFCGTRDTRTAGRRHTRTARGGSSCEDARTSCRTGRRRTTATSVVERRSPVAAVGDDKRPTATETRETGRLLRLLLRGQPGTKNTTFLTDFRGQDTRRARVPEGGRTRSSVHACR